jgi:hypothetical protein
VVPGTQPEAPSVPETTSSPGGGLFTNLADIGKKVYQKATSPEVQKKAAEVKAKINQGFAHPGMLQLLASISGGGRPFNLGEPGGVETKPLLPPGLVSTARRRSKEDEEQTAEDMKKIGKHERNRRRQRLLQPAGLI